VNGVSEMKERVVGIELGIESGLKESKLGRLGLLRFFRFHGVAKLQGF